MSRIRFPIITTIKYGGHEDEYILDRGDIVRCYFCNERFLISTKDIVIPDKYDNKAVRCPKCKKVVSVLYYYDRIIGKETKNGSSSPDNG